jgi:enoyl-CoA hydratase
MKEENIRLNVQNGIGFISINRPQQLNALNISTIKELNENLKKVETDKTIKVVILSGEGNKAFVAGADIKEFANFSKKEGEDLARYGQESLFNLIEKFSKPVIAAVNGFALGGGLELAMSCHIRIASENAKMGLPEVSLGVIPGYGGTQRLAQLVGKGRAFEMITTAQMITAKTALDYGLINHLVPQQDLIDKCIGIAILIMKNSPNAIAYAIKSINAGFENDIDGFKVEISSFGDCFENDEFKEGTKAFLEKRKPNF